MVTTVTKSKTTLPARKVQVLANHRDGNKQNNATREVIAAGWSLLVLDRVKDLRDLMLVLSSENIQLMAPILDVLEEAHNKSRENAVGSGGILKSKAARLAKVEFAAIRKDIVNGSNPHLDRRVLTLESELIDAYTLGKGIAAGTFERGNDTPLPAARESVPTVIPPSPPRRPEVDIDEPPNWPNSRYTCFESCVIWDRYQDDARLKRESLPIVLEYAKTKKANWYKLYAKHKKGEVLPDHTWGDVGRRPKLTSIDGVLKDLVEKERAVNGHNVPMNRIQCLCRDAMIQEWLDRGKNERDFKEPCKNTLEFHCSKVLAHPAIEINKKVGNKSQTRFAAEDSERSTIAYTMAMAASHYWIGKKDKNFHVMDDAPISNGAKIFRELVKESHGKIHPGQEIMHVLPALVTTTDACTTFGTIGQVTDAHRLYLSVKPSKDSSSLAASSAQRGNVTTERHGDRHLRGLRVEVNSTFNAKGQVAPLFAAVYGMSKDEMPNDEIIVLPIEGLINGSHQNPNCLDVGYLLFVRGKLGSDGEEVLAESSGNLGSNGEVLEESLDTSSAGESESVLPNKMCKEARVSQIYREKVYYPFINGIRMNDYGWDGIGEVPDSLRAVSWMDGANGQMSLTTSEDSLDKDSERNIRLCKHSAARTGVEQAADVSAGFRVFKSIVKWLTFEDVPASCCGLKRRVLEGIQNNRNLKLPAFKVNAIVDYMTKLPVMTSRAFHENNTEEGFLRIGQIDRVSRQLPDIYAVFDTKRFGADLPQSSLNRSDDRDAYEADQYCLHKQYFRTIFQRFFPMMFLYGHITESEFDKYGYTMDVDSHGNVVTKDQGISLENRQRSKIPSHPKQRELRINLIVEKKQEFARLERKHYDDERKIFDLNEQCEELLMTEMRFGQEATFVPFLSGLEAKHFGKKAKAGQFPSVDQIKAFIKVRSERTFTLSDKPKYVGVSGNRSILIEKALDKIFTRALQPSLHDTWLD